MFSPGSLIRFKEIEKTAEVINVEFGYNPYDTKLEVKVLLKGFDGKLTRMDAQKLADMERDERIEAIPTIMHPYRITYLNKTLNRWVIDVQAHHATAAPQAAMEQIGKDWHALVSVEKLV